MGFLDKAKAAASDLAAKADTAMTNAGMSGTPPSGGGDAENYFRDLGVLAFLEASGRPSDPGEHQRVMTALQEMDGRGAIRSFTLHTSPPPAPGAAAAASQAGFPPAPGAPGSTSPPPPPGASAPQSHAPAAAQAPLPPAPSTTAPPPPPSWMTKDETDNG